MTQKLMAALAGLVLIASLGVYSLIGGEYTESGGADSHAHSDGADHADESDHADGQAATLDAHAGEDEDEQELVLTAENLSTAGVRIEVLAPVVLGDSITVPAEIKSNAYNSSIVTPRMAAIVVKRHKRLSETVETGDPLVTLFSRDVADAEGELLVADREWRRVRRLGREVVSERRYLEAQVARQQAEAQLLSYGLGQDAVDAITSSKERESHAHGEFTLLAGQGGVIISDDFRDGELIEPGQLLFEIVDLDSVWVIARLDIDDASAVRIGGRAWVQYEGGTQEAEIEQIRSTVDEETRTVDVRILASNVARKLRPGQFVQAEIERGDGEPVLAVPSDALVRSPDGDWIIFEQDDDGGLKPLEVERERIIGEWTVIEGIRAGTSVAVSGAFFLQSELAKGGFDIHNH